MNQAARGHSTLLCGFRGQALRGVVRCGGANGAQKTEVVRTKEQRRALEQPDLAGTAPSAKQLQASRDQQGTGRKGAAARQKDADEGIFAERNTGPTLFAQRGDVAVDARFSRRSEPTVRGAEARVRDLALEGSADEAERLVRSSGLQLPKDGSPSAQQRKKILRYGDTFKHSSKASRRVSNQPVIRLTGNELGQHESFEALRFAAQQWFNENLRGKTATTANGEEVGFNRTGMMKATSKGEDLLPLVPAIRSVIEQGEVVDVRPGDRLNIKSLRILAAPVEIAGEIKQVAVSIRETTNGRFHYDLTWDSGERKLSTRGRSETDGDVAGKATFAPALEGTPGELNLYLLDEDFNAAVQPSASRIGRQVWRGAGGFAAKERVWIQARSRLLLPLLDDLGLRGCEHAFEAPKDRKRENYPAILGLPVVAPKEVCDRPDER